MNDKPQATSNNFKQPLTMKKPHYVTDKALKQFIKSALEEDIKGGDHSTLSTIPEDLEQSAKLLVKEDCILAGVELAEFIFKTLKVF